MRFGSAPRAHTADEAAAGMLALIAAKHHVVRQWKKAGEPSAPFVTHGLVYTDPGNPPVVVENRYIVNPQTGMMYLFILEGPQADREKVEALGKMIFGRMRLDPGR